MQKIIQTGSSTINVDGNHHVSKRRTTRARSAGVDTATDKSCWKEVDMQRKSFTLLNQSIGLMIDDCRTFDVWLMCEEQRWCCYSLSLLELFSSCSDVIKGLVFRLDFFEVA
jgi:hypothetical protein